MPKILKPLVAFLLAMVLATGALAQSTHNTAMGFTPWPVDFTEAGLKRTYAFANSHSNLMAHHFDGGIPWDEARAGSAFPRHLQEDWSRRLANTPRRSKVFVSVTPLNFGRDGLAQAWTARGDNQPLSAAWAGRRLNDPNVKAAYLAYVRRVIRAFDPDFLAIGIETNIIISKKPGIWNDYVELNAHVYSALKRENPRLPIFSTVQYEHLRGIEDDAKANVRNQRPAVRALMRDSDYLALSTYRYGKLHPNPMSADFFDVAKSFRKPIAIAESGAMSKGVWVFGVPLPASEKDQTAFMTGLMQHAVQNRFPFVVNWVAVDFNPGLKRLPRPVREIAKAWVHTGLQTSRGKDKPALRVWDAYLAQSRP